MNLLSQSDSGRKGKLNFEDFMNLVTRLFPLGTGGGVPTSAIARDLFDQIDIKSDGLIDIHEWVQAFKIDKLVAKDQFLYGEQMPDSRKKELHTYPLPYQQTKPYLELLEAVGKNIKQLRLMFRQLDEKQSGLIEFNLGVALFIKFVREVLDFTPSKYDDLYLEQMTKPFVEIISGIMTIRHQDFSKAVKQRYFLTRQATNNRLASFPKEVVTFNSYYN